MKTLTRFGLSITALTLLGSLATPAAQSAERKDKYFTVVGKVLEIDKKDRTLLVTDRHSKKLYLVEIPEGAMFKITFGRYMKMAQPAIEDVRAGERVEIRCVKSDTDHFALLKDGRSASKLIAAR